MRYSLRNLGRSVLCLGLGSAACAPALLGRGSDSLDPTGLRRLTGGGAGIAEGDGAGGGGTAAAEEPGGVGRGAGVGLGGSRGPPAEATPAGSGALPRARVSTSDCNDQSAQAFLIRSNYSYRRGMSAEEGDKRRALHQAAIEYRTRRYGFVEGFGERLWNRYDPVNYSEKTRFFGISVRLHRKVVPVLHCVEAEIRRACQSTPYAPERLHGIRFRNTFSNGEVSNHTYGISIDLDPGKNPCCGCVPPANSREQCSIKGATPLERTIIPKCWIDAFTRFGFYWYGYDPMEDTMHFDFLGDPDRVLRTSG